MKRPCIAFKMNYCDGGGDAEHIGYRGICGDAVIRYNIAKAKHSWCSNDECECKKFFDGKISRRKLETFWAPDDPERYTCYESALLRDWFVEAGWNADGVTPRKINNVEERHLCVLTTKYPDKPEDSRFVFALFIIHEIFSGDADNAGHVAAGEDFCLEFRPREAEQMKFWDIYQNPNAPNRIQWGSGLFRYFDDATAVKFLERAVEVKRGTPEENFAKEILRHYPYR